MTRARDLSNLMGSGNFSSTTFTATAGQTAFTIAHTQGFVQVFMNGLLLDLTTDYTSNGSAITLTTAAAAGDEIEVVKYNTFSVGDAVPASGGTFTGSINASAGLTTPAGHVIQVQQAVMTDRQQVSAGSMVNVGSNFEVAITPSSTSSKILVQTSLTCIVHRHELINSRLRRAVTGGSTTNINLLGWYNYTADDEWTSLTIAHNYLDSPSTTSTCTYKTQIGAYRTTYGGFYVNYNNTQFGGTTGDSRSTITAMEIAG